MNKQPINFPCICGHSRINHRPNNKWTSHSNGCAVQYCQCLEFKADNLKYLENKCDKQ